MFTAKISHSKETLKRFTIIQYDTFEFMRKVILAVISLVLIVFGFVQLTGGNSLLGIICLALGCILVTNLNYRAQSVADQVAEAMKGIYPTITYIFTENGFNDGEGRPEVAYKKIYRLIADDEYLYIFTSKASGYMMETATVGGSGGAGELKKLLCDKTGLEWTRPLSLASFSLRDAVKLVKQTIYKK